MKNKLILLLFFSLLYCSLIAQESTYKLIDSIHRLTENISLPDNFTQKEGLYESFSIQGRDPNNNIITLNVIVISDVYHWKYRKTTEINRGTVEEELPEILEGWPPFEDSYNVVAVGTASYEGNDRSELIRSHDRAQNMAKIIQNSHLLTNKQKLFYFPLGRYNLAIPTQSKKQRRMIIIGTLKEEPKLKTEDLEYSIKDALAEESFLDIDISKYKNHSQFKLIEVN